MKYFNSDITKTNLPAIVHGCNCQGVMGSGVALAIRTSFPEAYKRYMDQEEYPLGDFCLEFIPSSSQLIGNLYTQENFGSDGKVYASTWAIDASLRAFIKERPMTLETFQIASPKIGCGLGGLDWETQVKSIYEKIESDIDDVEFHIYEI